MIIPERFKLCGLTFTVKYQKGLNHNEDVHGWAKYRTQEIILQQSTEQTPLSRECVEQNFCHELVHHILYLAGEDSFEPSLHKREYLVDRIAPLIHQAITTGEGQL